MKTDLRTGAGSGDIPVTEGAAVRQAMRHGRWEGMTVHRCPGLVQANLVVLPRMEAFDFLVFCQRNPKACPVIEVTDPGDPEPRFSTPGADLRTDLARYAVYRRGELTEEVSEIASLWREDLVAFLIGSSLTFDHALERAGVPRSPVWVLETGLPCVPAGRFSGPLVVTMRWMTPAQAILATQLTARFPFNHGAPIHIGDPAALGVNLLEPLSGPPVREIPAGLIPVFWACGVTPQRVAIASRTEFMITHLSGYAFITDLQADRICQP